MESAEVKIARLEEAMVTVKGDTKYIRGRIDHLLWNVALIAGGSSVLVALLVTLVSRQVFK